MSVEILNGDCIEVLKELPAESVHCCVTSPPYWGLRDYGVEGQIGLETSVNAYIEKMVAVFREVWRVLRNDGTLWLNLGDTYCNSDGYKKPPSGSRHIGFMQETNVASDFQAPPNRQRQAGFKPKDLMGIPWRVALALQADGWYLRQDIIWHKPNPMPESVRDRCTKSHEYIFLMSKSERYYFDKKAISEPCAESNASRPRMGQGTNSQYHQKRASRKGSAFEDGKKLIIQPNVEKQRKPAGWDTGKGGHGSFHREGRAKEVEYTVRTIETKNKRSVWKVSTQPFKAAHFATFPMKLIEPCIMAGCPDSGTVLDPFGGAGTTGIVAAKLGRNALLIELNPEYVAMAKRRLNREVPLLA